MQQAIFTYVVEFPSLKLPFLLTMSHRVVDFLLGPARQWWVLHDSKLDTSYFLAGSKAEALPSNRAVSLWHSPMFIIAVLDL